MRALTTMRAFPARQPPLDLLIERKGNRRVAVVLPARDEAATIASIVDQVRGRLRDEIGLVDELIVMDHGSSDETAAVAERAGAAVIPADSVLADFGPVLGKGDVLWRSIEASSADFIVWIDADLESFTNDYVTRLVAPLLLSRDISLVKGTYDRALHGDTTGGGRVTELAAKPVLRLLHPYLGHIQQPLAGEYAIRRDVAEAIAFEVDYGVEVGLLIDVAEHAGVASITQMDLGTRVHRNRDLGALGEQSEQVLRAVLARSGMPVGERVVRPPIAALRARRDAMRAS